jgi:hypothetical protein
MFLSKVVAEMRMGDLLEEFVKALAFSDRAIPEEDTLTLLNLHNVVNVNCHPKIVSLIIYLQVPQFS